MHFSTDAGYVALLTMLVIVPAAAVATAVLDRAMWRRRAALLRRPLSTAHAFPVIIHAESKPSAAPIRVLSVEGKPS
jgi:hypothetical protein